jgi:hypothetical protein
MNFCAGYVSPSNVGNPKLVRNIGTDRQGDEEIRRLLQADSDLGRRLRKWITSLSLWTRTEDLSASSPTKKVPPRPSLSSRSSRHRARLRDEPNQSNNCAPRLLACMLYQALKRGTADDSSQPKIGTGSARIHHAMRAGGWRDRCSTKPTSITSSAGSASKASATACGV